MMHGELQLSETTFCALKTDSAPPAEGLLFYCFLETSRRNAVCHDGWRDILFGF